MRTGKPSILIICMAFYLGPVCCHAGGRLFWYGNNAAYTGQYTSPAYTHTSPPGRIIGPVTSFSNAYGPVPAFGLRNYPNPEKSDLYYRHNGFSNNYITQPRGRNNKKRINRKSGNIFGYTYNPDNADPTE